MKRIKRFCKVTWSILRSLVNSVWIDKRFGFYREESMIFDGHYYRFGFVTFCVYKNFRRDRII